jgi:hypothetical protein
MMSFARMLGATAVALAIIPAAFGQSCSTCGTPQTGYPFHCPPKFLHWSEGPPKLKFKNACPKPVCDPCNLPHAGYYEPCWSPWPWASDWSHCALPPSALTVEDVPPNAVPTYTPRAPTSLPPAMDGPPAARPMNQDTRLPASPNPIQNNIEARPVNR